jgi:hypothetical protein
MGSGSRSSASRTEDHETVEHPILDRNQDYHPPPAIPTKHITRPQEPAEGDLSHAGIAFTDRW